MTQAKNPPLGEQRPFGEATCMRATGADVNADLCGAKATTHLMWADTGGENALACDTHAREAINQYPITDLHPVGAMCNMPGSHWVYTANGQVGQCLWHIDDEELVAQANGEIPVALTVEVDA